MPKVKVPFQIGYGVNTHKTISDSECLNMYPIVNDSSGSVTQLSMTEIEGVTDAGNNTISATVGAGAQFRGAVNDGSRVFFVYDNYLFSAQSGGTVIVHGIITALTAASYSIPVSLATNGNLIAILTAGQQEIAFYDKTTLVITITSPPNSFYAYDVTYDNGHFVYLGGSLNAGVTQFSHVIFHGLTKTDASKGAAFNALDFTETDMLVVGGANPNGAIVSHDGIIYAMGRYSTELYQFSGEISFAYRKLPQRIDIGCYNNSSRIQIQSGVYIMGGGDHDVLGIYRINGSSFQKISTSSVDKEIESQLPASYMRCNVWNQAYESSNLIGFNFFNSTLLTSGKTFVYDFVDSRHEFS